MAWERIRWLNEINITVQEYLKHFSKKITEKLPHGNIKTIYLRERLNKIFLQFLRY